ncbi:oplophorus-luciferin 2-monooxygenase non-catalytic subunit-like [Penaeus japonicus]|uniref:oplophorus-luciferin 2-monooxygenase non-catalytic subunit-like n=1 Tax=Penaeus japonicus TaxID=27405 RepID=UPI001C7139A4|nr:oplophorus-luciferin 2-monooxygenase non-catalytic subunit-like [Penaeus japonicus]
MALLFPLVVLALASVHGGCAESSSREGGPRELPCPNAEDISPCECTLYNTYLMTMHCSDVDNAELARVFSAHFPFTEFWHLDTRRSERLDVLREGDLGVVSFEYIDITASGLKEVQAKALSQSYSTVKRIGLSDNQISSFPFDELPLFTSLSQLYLYSNDLDHFPQLESEYLTMVSLSFNRVSEIPVDGFKGVPNLEIFYFEGNNLRQITPGTFAGLQRLRGLYLPNNNLNHIHQGAFETSSTSFRVLTLSSSHISSIEPNAITGLKGGELWLDDNALTSVDEAVFRPLLEDEVQIYLEGNPLACECDIAWLVMRPELMSRIADAATCFNGQLLVDLDPAIYENLC